MGDGSCGWSWAHGPRRLSLTLLFADLVPGARILLRRFLKIVDIIKISA